MIKFFRRIRQQLLRERKFSKYLLYAIGEIFLVVIGILIALQLNNWNESRKDRNEEQLVVQTIYDELNQNLQYSTSVASQIEGRLNMTITLMGYTAAQEAAIPVHVFDSIMVRAFLFPPYTPIKADMERVLGSDQIDLIRSTELQKRLSDYKTSIDGAALYYRYAEDDFKLLILPYFVKNYPLKALLLQYGMQVPPSAHKSNYNDLLASREFENILSVIFADSGGQLQALSANLSLIEVLKDLIEKEYPSVVKNN
ncbi:hypothetical protein GWK08_08500 [Leptobacterium flavescens]|uniref:Uncharacterized protein n=1 Tax=Leptobacterium flavescens TaxID=472055 RepID=A0A6P0URI6_9FLAO|nr:DUF6090 family protein [Leptobacterium flavescens]NER13473.1 hypothetical protein [Leptobacterium flavescens]